MSDLYDPYQCIDASGIEYPEHDYSLFGCWRCGAEWDQCEEIEP